MIQTHRVENANEIHKRGERKVELKEFVEKVESGYRYRIDFLKKEALLNGKKVELTAPSIINPYSVIELLYQNFKHSYPSERSSHHSHDYFKALSMDEMSDADMVNGEERTVARCKLEAFILTQVLNGNLKWFDATKYFWKSENDSDLVLLKEWIVI